MSTPGGHRYTPGELVPQKGSRKIVEHMPQDGIIGETILEVFDGCLLFIIILAVCSIVGTLVLNLSL